MLDVQRLLEHAVEARAFPGAIVEVGSSSGPRWRIAAGRLTFDPTAPAVDDRTIYDLASLTKVLCTTTLAMRHVERKTLDLEERVNRLVAWTGPEREAVAVWHLLAHASGLPAWRPLSETLSGRREFEHAIARERLEYEPGTRSIYSDLGFMLLGFILDDAARLPLDRQVEPLFRELGTDDLRFVPPPSWLDRTAPTQLDPDTGQPRAGVVDDANARALGGVAGHAGLFGTAEAVGRVARSVLAALGGEAADLPPLAQADTLRRFIARTPVPGSSRALGWDTMLPTSSCGRLMSRSAFGHTGFTGTSLWIDPEVNLYVVFLTNRVHPTPENDAIRAIRPALHDAIVQALRP